MTETKKLNFKISSALKSIIGKDLITNDLVAVFELVKNSFDAQATEVRIVFKNLDNKSSSISIIDNGKGMSFDDLNNKWLFVAYSAKHDGTEDEDYRDKIITKRVYAGAKGIGRFSCDRLGKSLEMITKKRGQKEKTNQLFVEWGDFETDSKQEFVNISTTHSYTNIPSALSKEKHGTILKIFNLRDNWNRKKILDLKHSLEKLINPLTDPNRKFKISIEAKDELESDKDEKLKRNKVNGYVQNFIFETLKLKTTQIITELSSDGKFITTELIDRGESLYSIKEKNELSFSLISNIKINLFYLNRAAKFNFSVKMGVDAINFGSVFLYKNGVRVYPFGDKEDDGFGLDRRKTQGQKRYLGTRELMGRINISSESGDFTETSSRDGGLIRNESYDQLVNFFINKSLKRLERYVVDVQWPLKDQIDDINFVNSRESQDRLLGVISQLTNSKNIESFEYNENFLDIINTKNRDSLGGIVRNFKRIASETGDKSLLKDAESAEKSLKSLEKAKDEAESEAENKSEQLKEKEEELEKEKRSNLFLSSAVSADNKVVLGLRHHIDHSSVKINKIIDNLKEAIENDKPKEELYNHLNLIVIENRKIGTLANFVTKANFNTMSTKIDKDLIRFIREYIEKVYREYNHLKINGQRLEIILKNFNEIDFILKFKPLEFIIIIDNLLNNAQKAGAKKMIIEASKRGNKLKIHFKDNGQGVNKKFIEKIFDFGFSTTTGQGLGLYHSRSIAEKIGGDLKFNPNYKKGAEFILSVNK